MRHLSDFTRRIHAPSHDVFVGRQPIFDDHRHLVASELLYRAAPDSGEARVTDDFDATAQLVRRAFQDLGIHSVVGRCQAFVNFDAETLLSPMAELLPRDQVVIELLETIEVDERVLRRCRELKAQGYRLALDDVCSYRDDCEALFPLVDVIKIDVLPLAHDALEALVRRLRRVAPGKLLAEKVDNAERADDCVALGFDLFQGYYFGRPAVLAA